MHKPGLFEKLGWTEVDEMWKEENLNNNAPDEEGVIRLNGTGEGG